MMWINGQPAEQVSARDRGLTLGDGFFTTLQVRDGKPLLWPWHQQRLLTCQQRLLFPPLPLSALEQEVRAVACGQSRAALKLILTRGEGARGYGLQGLSEPTRILACSAYPGDYLRWQRDGIRLGVCTQRLGHSPLLAGLKSLNRLEQVLLKGEVEQQGWLDALVLDIRGRVVETVTANVFWRRDSVVYTPRLDLAGVAGVMRGWVMQRLAAWGYSLEQVAAPLASLEQAEEVWITNALMEIVPVTGIMHVNFQQDEVARRLQAAFAAPG